MADERSELIRSSELAPNVPYAYAAVVRPGGSLVFTAGACPLDADGRVVAVGDLTRQAEATMDNLRLALKASNATIADVVKTTIYVASTDRADLVAAWNVVEAAFGDHDVPSTLVGVSVLGYEHQLVEIEAVAVLD